MSQKSEQIAAEIFKKIEEAQGFAFISDGLGVFSVKDLYKRLNGCLDWHKRCVSILTAFLRKKGQLRK